jgi:branched-chain amino acid transport system substrate-binding protein
VFRLLILFVAVMLGMAGTACEPALPRPVAPPTASPAAVEPIVIGAILDVGRDAGPDSRQRYDAATLAVELVNRRGGVLLPAGERRPLQLVVYDDGGQPNRAEPAVRRLLIDGALAIIGPSDSESTAVVRPAAEAAGMPLIALDETSGNDSANWRWTFALGVPPEEALAATIDFFLASGVDRLGWLAPRTMEASSLRRALLRLASAAQMQVVGEELYPPGDEEYVQRLARLQAAEPRVILAWPRDTHEAASIAREAARVPNVVPVFLGPAASSPSTLALAGDAAGVVRTVTLRLPVSDDLWDHDALTPVIRDFRRELQARTGRAPTAESAGAWDAVRLIVATLERPTSSSTPLSRTTIRDGLEATTDYLGASGTIAFGARRHDGLDRRALVVARSEGRRWRLPP